MNNSVNPNLISQTIAEKKQAELQAKMPQQPVMMPVEPKKKSNAGLIVFLILIILGCAAYIYYDKNYLEKSLMNNCPKLKLTNGDLTLKTTDTLVVNLYNRVVTTAKEDLADNTLDDAMKLYLAYRNMPNYLLYDSNCNLFDSGNMLPFTCDDSVKIPKAFKAESLQNELKMLFGESTTIANKNITLGSSCLGGYEYIDARGEYVEGTCSEVPTTPLSATKKLASAYQKDDEIILKEVVDYYGTTDQTLLTNYPDGTYIYTFKLDATNNDYVYISKVKETK
jgi:hypothetical protein